MSAFRKLGLVTWGVRETVRLGRPAVSVGFFGGIGDDLLCTAAIHELSVRGTERIWFFSRFPALYVPPRGVSVVPEDGRYLKLAEVLGAPMRPLSYSPYDPVRDRDVPTSEHIVAAMCRLAGIRGKIAIRPHLSVTEPEKLRAAPARGAVVMQTSIMSAAAPMRNKQWAPSRFQDVANRLSKTFKLIQIGSPNDPPLVGAEDLRGKTSLRQSAAILSQARLFIGLPGFLMHLARAVECPAVIVYGGRELPETTGYICNKNIASRPSCSPCWQRNRCDFDHVCMTGISADEVVDTAIAAISMPSVALPVEEITIA